MKKLLIGFLTSILLTGCLGGGSSSEAPATVIAIVEEPTLPGPTQQDPGQTPDPGNPSNPPQNPSGPSNPPVTPPTPYSFGGGQGTLNQPYLIQTPEDLQHIRDFPAAQFWINNPINMTGINFEPIPNFSGIIYGNNYYISNLTINYNSASTAAFVQVLSGTLVQIKFQNLKVSGLGFATGFAGNITATGFVSSCVIAGIITSPSGGNGYNTGVGNPSYVTKHASGRISGVSQFVTFNGNNVNNSF